MTTAHAVSPELTGGAGYTYEDTVVAYYLASLLREEGAAGQAGVVTRVAVQQAPAFPLDDLVVRFDHQGAERMLSLQVRCKVVISGAESNARFREILCSAAATLSDPKFGAGTDAYGFVAEYAAQDRLRDPEAADRICREQPRWSRFRESIRKRRRGQPGGPQAPK